MLLAALAAAVEVETESMDAFLEELAARRDAIHVVRADIHRENTTPDGIFEAQGAMVYARPRRIVFRYEDPVVTDLLIDDRRIYRYDEDMEQLLVDDLDDDPATEALYLGFEKDFGRLREAFELSFFIPETKEGAVKGLLLKPRKEANGDETGPAAVFEAVYLYLREEDYLPTRVVVVNDEESRVELRMSDYEVNCPIEPEETQFRVPEGTMIVENQEAYEEAPPGGLLLPRDPVIPKAVSSPEETSSP
ncbi:MAG: outer membrane lipoprotein carrier protein LolA [Candidatus Hydrogenedentota bacterium]